MRHDVGVKRLDKMVLMDLEGESVRREGAVLLRVVDQRKVM